MKKFPGSFGFVAMRHQQNCRPEPLMMERKTRDYSENRTDAVQAIVNQKTDSRPCSSLILNIV